MRKVLTCTIRIGKQQIGVMYDPWGDSWRFTFKNQGWNFKGKAGNMVFEILALIENAEIMSNAEEEREEHG